MLCKFSSLLLLGLLSVSLLFAQVKTDTGGKSWMLHTSKMSYTIKILNDRVQTGYYGPLLSIGNGNPDYFSAQPETPVRGSWANKSPILEVVFKDDTRDLDLKYEASSVSQKEGYSLLRIDQKDTYYPIKVSSFYRVIPEFDIIEKWLEITNTGTKDIIKIENALSGSLWLPQGSYEMTHFNGIHWHDFQPHTTLLTQGIKTIDGRAFKTYGTSYFAVRPEGEKSEHHGSVWYGQLHYSGNWKTDFESMYDDKLQIVSGINFWDTEWNLRPKETFTTPVFSFGYTSDGTGAAAQNYSDYTRKIILPKKRSTVTRPVIYNSWYPTEFNINEQQQLELAKIAKEVGVEMFVIDDGWFKGRVDDKGGLGDWTVDKTKFPNGLNPLIKQINDMGMSFGIWVEPEMVNPNSDLYRAHPDWVFNFKNRTRTTGRNQLMLNFGRQDVYNYIYNSLYNLLKDHNIKYVKWDMNKHLTEPGWPDAADPAMQREARIRHIDNLYKMLDKLTTTFPDVWFETCSSGGGRVDLGIFKRADAAWVSDNIDPVDRVYIQYAYLSAFPANTMISWTGYYDNHGVFPTLDFRFDVAMSGVLGIGNDMRKWNEKELQIAKSKVAEYKTIRNTVHNGKLYRLASPFETNRSALQYVNNDQSEIVIFCYELGQQLKGSSKFPYENRYFKLMGLNAGKQYSVEGQKEIYTGDQLMNVGIAWPLSKANTSKILKLKAL